MRQGPGYRSKILWSLAAFVALCIGVAFIAVKGNLPALKLDKDQSAFWDVFFKGVGGVVAIVGGAVALSKFLDERAKANHTEAIKAREPFFNKRQEVYNALVTATANIATHDLGSDGRKAADEQFWTLFWGALPMVADDDVGAAVNTFHLVLTDSGGDQVALRNASIDIARACRKSLWSSEF